MHHQLLFSSNCLFQGKFSPPPHVCFTLDHFFLSGTIANPREFTRDRKRSTGFCQQWLLTENPPGTQDSPTITERIFSVSDYHTFSKFLNYTCNSFLQFPVKMVSKAIHFDASVILVCLYMIYHDPSRNCFQWNVFKEILGRKPWSLYWKDLPKYLGASTCA